MTGAVNVPGEPVTLGGKEYILPPLSAGACKQYRAKIEQVALNGVPPIDLVAELAHASLKRNYPDLTFEQVENELIDRSNFWTVWDKLMHVSGMVAQMGEMVRRVQQIGVGQILKS